jgi:hypothetical protein
MFGVQLTIWVLLVAQFVIFTIQGFGVPAVLSGVGACIVGYSMALSST